MYRIVWEFEPITSRTAEFEQAYGSDGAWVDLFRRGEGFLGTDLYRSVDHPGQYVTVDRWTSRSAYEAFRAAWGADYAAIDARCERLTRAERFVAAIEEP